MIFPILDFYFFIYFLKKMKETSTEQKTKKSAFVAKPCIHPQKRPSRCKECNPDSPYFCPCGKIESACTTCKTGSGICPCGNLKSTCKTCKGAGRCKPHNHLKSTCKQSPCFGGSICEHSKVKSQCRDCNPEKCEHGKLIISKASCVGCGGSSICEHKIHKALCSDPKCGGGS